ncbi:MAG: hypothetical protein EZS28_013722 [Streblomastix strix]|uniref:Uncharacterized protein n=1 Tax=Streblomastix strix TaxID=222440 RepID=A0A5J4W842_9EUKA|nr:MAG: hypothetical protein EZS28_013722 [Streblomastix strix]
MQSLFPRYTEYETKFYYSKSPHFFGDLATNAFAEIRDYNKYLIRDVSTARSSFLSRNTDWRDLFSRRLKQDKLFYPNENLQKISPAQYRTKSTSPGYHTQLKSPTPQSRLLTPPSSSLTSAVSIQHPHIFSSKTPPSLRQKSPYSNIHSPNDYQTS